MVYKLLILILLLISFTILLCKYEKNVEKLKNINSNKLIKNIENSEKKLICFSLWGDNECYNWGALENALLAKKIYPGWICRFYIGQNVIPDVIKHLRKLDNVELIFMKENKAMTNMFWRFIPIFREECKMYLSRDTDSRLNVREQIAVKIWEKSEKDMIIIRDHYHHNKRVMGGMFGVRNNLLTKFKKKFDVRYNSSNMRYGDDQEFLEKVIYPKVKNNCIIFDKKNYFSDENALQIPENEFPTCVGQVDCKDYSEIEKTFGLKINSVKRVRDHSNN